MRLFAHYTHDLYEAFDPALHCEPWKLLFACKITEAEDAYATIELSRQQSGWKFLSPSQPKNVLVSWSPTGKSEDALLFARGRVKERPRDLLGRRQTVFFECAPRDIDELVLAKAKAEDPGAPTTDFLFSDTDVQDKQAYLLGRAEVWHVDPATHAIRTVHLTEGDRTLDMRNVAFFENGIPSDGPGDAGAKMAATLRQRLVVDWTQEASGVNNVGPSLADLPTIAPLNTLDPHFFEVLSSAFRSDESEGWSLADAGVDYTARKRESNLRQTGTRYRSLVTDPTNENQGEQELRADHHLSASFMIHTLTSCSFPLRYEYQQSRREVVHAALDLPVLDTGIEYEDDELSELSLRDVFVDPRATEWEPGPYKAGELVRKNGETYRCRRDHVSTDFRELMGTVQARDLPVFAGTAWGLVGNFEVQQTFWELVSGQWAVKPSMYSFFDTTRGKQAIRHLMLRMRRAGILALRDSRIGMRFRWEDAAHLTRANSITFLVPDEDGLREVTGKILALERDWPEEGAPTVFVEVGVSFAADLPALSSAEAYGMPDYGSGDYGADEVFLPSPAANDLTFETMADAVRKPVLVEQLGGDYGVRRIRQGGMAAEQLAVASALAMDGADVRECSVIRPSWVEVSMRPLPQLETIVRDIDVVGELVRGSQGVTI